ncbi:unnamed protein product [Rotaria magnacalcarata]|uniref:Transposase n=2 Tax=Rotaria magnacalcarata TaxID=392030 RepID=A0A820H4E9_9BILA|nr:unnamed protein product [Rotaria magnacalcarata]CAF4289010.1 unnamed protein product [Rotaria magnacalcarata]
MANSPTTHPNYPEPAVHHSPPSELPSSFDTDMIELSVNVLTVTTGSVLIRHVERGQTIDHDYYINNCLQPLVNEIKKQRPSSGTHAIKIHHDNARPHVHKDVSAYLELQGIMKMLQPSNSPNLALRFLVIRLDQTKSNRSKKLSIIASCRNQSDAFD